VVVAGQIDVFPAQWRQMGQIARFRMVPLPLNVIDGSLQVRRVPQNYGGHDQIQPARAVTLVLVGTVADFTESVEEHRSAKRILRKRVGSTHCRPWETRHLLFASRWRLISGRTSSVIVPQARNSANAASRRCRSSATVSLGRATSETRGCLP